MGLLSVMIDEGCQSRSSSSLSLASGVTAVIGTFVGMTCRPAVHEKMCISLCCRVGFGAIGLGNIWHDLWRVFEVKGLVLLSGLPSKVTMVMMTLSAFLIEKHIA